ncbi:MAG TPA: hypothetical protein VFM96_05805 [Gaiellaceae bacterium]|nr:hypothetical protein [Gaiellaceae bacterium]
MEYTIEFNGEGPSDLTITLRGVGDPDTVARCNTEFASDSRFRSGLLMLVDLSEFESQPMTETEAETAIKRIQERDWDHPVAAIAFVVADEQAAHEFMQWRARLGGSRSHREVFTSRADADAWLATQRAK